MAVSFRPGAFGASLGLGGTLVRDRHRAAAALRVWQSESNDGYRPGTRAHFDLAWWYRLSPERFRLAVILMLIAMGVSLVAQAL